jgi:hypothetical protein
MRLFLLFTHQSARSGLLMSFVGIFFLELLGYTLALRIFLGVPLAAGPAIYAAAIMVGLYVFDFVGSLRIASQFIHAGGLVALAASVAMTLRSPLPEFRSTRKISLVALVLAERFLLFLPVSDERARVSADGRVLPLGNGHSRGL